MNGAEMKTPRPAAAKSDIAMATRRYEAWVARQTPPVADDLALKHARMATTPFFFLRASFYRWAQRWPKVCPALAEAPHRLAVGDLHIENFGTWRDSEGRLVWGINDFDEAFPLPYTNDLVRLAVSAHLAISAGHLALRPADACEAILKGYTRQLKGDARPFVLAEQHRWLRSAVLSELRDPTRFWEKLNGCPTVTARVPGKAKKALAAALPEERLVYRTVHRVAGLGSLGRQRLVALAEWKGGLVAREAKPLLPSAC